MIELNTASAVSSGSATLRAEYSLGERAVSRNRRLGTKDRDVENPMEALGLLEGGTRLDRWARGDEDSGRSRRLRGARIYRGQGKSARRAGSEPLHSGIVPSLGDFAISAANRRAGSDSARMR